MKLFSLVVLCALAAPFAHASTQVECRAVGFKTAQSGGRQLYTEARLRFSVADFDRSDKVLELGSVRGVIKVGDEKEEVLTSQNAYIGYFRFAGLKSDPDYNPRKYVGYVKFASFDAAHTTGYESGMWGDFLLARNLRTAKYVFKAGDHMGGTVHLTCRAQE